VPLLKPEKAEGFYGAYPSLEKEVSNWVAWQKGRKGRLLFPIEDSRGRPTLALFKLATLLYLERSFSGSFSAQMLHERDQAAAGSLGKVEDVLMGLLVLSSKYNIEDLKAMVAPMESISTLKECAGLLQRLPEQQQVLLNFHRHTPTTLLGKLYHRISDRGIQEYHDAVRLIDFSQEAYINWLVDGRSIRRDWQSQWWKVGAQYLPIKSLTALGKGGVVLTFLMMILGIVLIFWNWIPANRGGMGLRIGSSLLLCLLLGLSLEWMPNGVGQDLSLKLNGPPKQNTLSQLTITPTDTEEIMKDDLPVESIQLMLIFLGIQILIFIWSCIQINRISKHSGERDLKIQLLENEDILFDMGLYIGLGGTVLSLVFMVLGHENQGLIAAYTSTLFGIIEVAVFKIFILRPYKQKLIVGV